MFYALYIAILRFMISTWIPCFDNNSANDNSTCTDCAGVVNGSSEVDDCGVCAGDNSTCADCAGVPNGNNLIDQCGICDDDVV